MMMGSMKGPPEMIGDMPQSIDKLETMFRMQKDLQDFLKMDMTTQSYINMNFMALSDELHELLHTTPWKPWKKQQTLDVEEAKKELVDLFHFYMNLCLAVGMGPDELFDRYKTKNMENVGRQLRGY